MKPNQSSEADILLDHTIVEVKSHLNAARTLRTALIQLAYALHDKERHWNAVLLLLEPQLTHGRLELEWLLVEKTLKRELSERLFIVVWEEGALRSYPKSPPPETLSQLDRIGHDQQRGLRHAPPQKPDFQAEITKLLLLRWLQGRGPISIDRITDEIGCSYPTAAKALNQLPPDLLERTGGFHLNHFPVSLWSNLVGAGRHVRQTIRFGDRSGKPPSTETMLRRIRQLHRPDLGLGGTVGARFHYPDLDLMGTPRVDLTLACAPHEPLLLNFVGDIDPALKEVSAWEPRVSLVIHLLRRRQAHFQPAELGQIADPIECLLDLHEMRLESAAQQFLAALINRR